ncbi:hypothetical protein Tco_1309526, partial [Tanacetum coccineum]
VPVTPEVGAAAVALLVGVLELDTHSSSEVNPSESSPPFVSIAHMVSPFLCLDDSKLYAKIPKRHVSPTPHDAMLTRWRSRVASRSSSPTTSTQEIPIAPILPAPSAIVARSSEFPLALSSGHSILGHSLSRHASPDTTIADSSKPPKIVHPPLARIPRSPAATVTSSIHATRALVPSCVDLLPPCKRFRDFISPEDSVEEDIDTDVLEDIKVDATAIEVAVDRDVVTGVDAGIDMEVDV